MSNERLQTLEDVLYLTGQMVYAERRVHRVRQLVFYYQGWSPNAVRLSAAEADFFSNAVIETFLLSYRNLLDFFHRPNRSGGNRRRDSRAEADFGFRRALVTNADTEFDRVSKHLAHLSEDRRTRGATKIGILRSF
jgi:hypothetical protein